MATEVVHRQESVEKPFMYILDIYIPHPFRQFPLRKYCENLQAPQSCCLLRHLEAGVDLVLLLDRVHRRCLGVTVIALAAHHRLPAGPRVSGLQLCGGCRLGEISGRDLRAVDALVEVLVRDLLQRGAGRLRHSKLVLVLVLGRRQGQQLAGRQRRHLGQVEVRLDAVRDDVHLGRLHKLERRRSPGVQLGGPVVDLNSSDNGVVSLLGVNQRLLNQVFEVIGDGSLSNGGQALQRHRRHVGLLIPQATRQALLQDRVLGVQHVVFARHTARSLVALSLELAQALGQRAART
eukprot:362342-Chlamydomonas_euryale.AAC.3